MNNRAKGILSIIISAFGFSLMALFVRLCDDYGEPVSAFQKGFFRNVVAFAIAAVAFARAGRSLRSADADARIPLPAVAWVQLGVRSFLGTVGLFANFYALGHITIAEGQTLNKTAPFFTVLFAWLFLGEKVTRRQFLPLLIAFAGVVLIAKPGFAGANAFPLAIGLMSGMCAGSAYACVRGLRRQGMSPTFIVLFFSAFSCLAAVPFMLAGFDPMTWQQVVILLGTGVGAAIGQFGITLAYGFAAPCEIAVYDYTNILFTAALGYVFFAQVPDVRSVLGFVAILLAAYRMFR